MTKYNSVIFVVFIKKAIPSVFRLFAPVGKSRNRFIPNLRVSIKDSVPNELYSSSLPFVKPASGIYHV